MSDKAFSEYGKLIIDLLIGFDRMQYAAVYDKADNPNAIYLLYSSMLKLINRAIDPDDRNSRLFRLKYHHILSNESVDEYLFHCLSKILSDLLEIENNYQKFIQPVADLHVKLMSILSKMQLEHQEIVLTNKRVMSEIERNGDKRDQSPEQSIRNTDDPKNQHQFTPVYFVPTNCCNKKLKKHQNLTFHAIHSHYSSNNSPSADILAMLLDFDCAFAEFELEFVCQVNKNSIFGARRAELTMLVAVMFSEAVQWAHNLDLLKYRSIAECDIEIMVGIPRLAVVYGCLIAKHGPLSEWSLNCRNEGEVEERLAPVFQDHRQDLCRLHRQLNILNATELRYLCRLLMDRNDSYDNDTYLASIKGETVGQHPSVSGDMHALFKLVSSVSDQMQTQHASDYRFFMEVVFKMYKDESDLISSMTSSSTSFECKSMPIIPDLIDNVAPCYPQVDEGVDALTYSLSDQFSSDSCFDFSFLSQFDQKTLPSTVEAHSEYSARQSSSVRYNCGQIANHNINPRRPQWRSDECFSRCCHCDRNFNVFRRKHHCRRCGYLFCSSCWGSKLALPTLGIHNKVPICVECEEFLNGKDGRYQVGNSTSSAT